MFNLYYPDVNGNLVLQGQFATQQAAIDKATADAQTNYTVQQVVGSDVVMVMSV